MPRKYAKLRGRITEKCGTIKNFADSLGCKPQSISRKLNGRLGFTCKDIKKYSEVLDIKPEEIGIFFYSES